jgi:hypothetical protein
VRAGWSFRSLMLVCPLLASCAAPPPSDAPQTQLRLRKEVVSPMLSHDDAKLSIDGDRAVIEVDRRRGIGSASVSLVNGTWPRRVVVRFEGFTSLESFEARSIDAQGNVLWRWPGGRPPYERFGDAIEVLLPQAALPAGATTIELSWIDAYRG